jgi:uracil-DNA glycosylase
MTADQLPLAFASIPTDWRKRLIGWSSNDESTIVEAVRRASGTRQIGPEDPFRALRLVAPDQVKVLVVGQDPYPGAGHADGLAFSAPTSTRPSLRRIFDVLEADRPGWRRPASGRLDAWAHQGVLLLNPTLTVELGHTDSHGTCGWRALTSKIVEVALASEDAPVVFLWGSKARLFWEGAATDGSSAQLYLTRHPSNDFRREFMIDGSHFDATKRLVDWWALPG